MIRVGLAVVAGALVCCAHATAGGIALDLGVRVKGIEPVRTVVVTARTAARASCTLTESMSGLRLHRTTSAEGRATWRWSASLWAHGMETIYVRCAKGAAHRSAPAYIELGAEQEVSVIRDYALHLVYWAPDGDMPADVAPAVTQFEADVKASLDAGATDNPFAVPRAYGDSLGGGDPRIASIDVTADTDPYRATTLDTTAVGNEATRVARAHGWPANNRTLIVIFTAPSVAVCIRIAGCSAKTEPCGFHWMTPTGYAYADVLMSAVGQCGETASPAPYALSLLDHEQNEAIVDPWGNGFEVADPCEGDFASIPINGHTYDLPAISENGTCSFAYTP